MTPNFVQAAFGPNNWDRKLKFCIQPLIVVIYIDHENLRSEVIDLRFDLHESEHQKTYDLITHMTYFHWFHILTSGGRWYLETTTSRIIWDKKGSQNGIGTPKKPMIWYLTKLIFIDFIFWPPEFIDIWRSRPPGSSVSYWNRNTKKPMIWYLTWTIYIDLIFWPF